MFRFAFALSFCASLALTLAAALSVRQEVWRGQLYQVVTVDPQRDKLRLFWKDDGGQPLLSFDALRQMLSARGQRLIFATNSGIYTPAYAPLGLHVEAGKTLVPLNRARSGGNFALLPNGVFWLSQRRAAISETKAYFRLNIRPDYATQSGPLLLQGGKLHPSFDPHSKSLKLRSGVSVCADKQVRFVLSRAPVNFYTFAVFFRDRLRCPDALYLDGSISAMYTPQLGGQWVNFAGMWGVVEGE